MGKGRYAMGLAHLPEKEIDTLCTEEPDITIRGYLELLKEIQQIEKAMEKRDNNAEILQGWTVLAQMISGWELAWADIEEDGTATPTVYDTERDAQLDIVDIIKDDIDQYIEGEREYEEIHRMDEYCTCPIEIKDGIIILWNDGVSREISLEEWRANR